MLALFVPEQAAKKNAVNEMDRHDLAFKKTPLGCLLVQINFGTRKKALQEKLAKSAFFVVILVSGKDNQDDLLFSRSQGL